MIVAVAVAPSTKYVTVAVPAATPVITVPLTEISEGLLFTTCTNRLPSCRPVASLSTTERVSLAPTFTELLDGVITICVTDGITTVAVALCPPLLAVIVAVPAWTAVTTPLALTVAVVSLLDVQTIVRPVNTFPDASLTIAVYVTVSPNDARVSIAGVTVMDATGTRVTVTVADAEAVPEVAVIVVVPGATPVTVPFASTVATPGVLEPHVMVRPVNTLPEPSLVTAVKVVVCPVAMLAVDALSVIVATGTPVTVIAACADFPSLVAVIVAAPVAFAVTSPALLTLAIVESLLAHVTVRPVSALPCASLGVATSVRVAPIAIEALV